ncbi:MAG: hypothetical protein EBS53_14725 [Bacteroidetes bacterium]|nr:hypothetical protein [Bacteroidota bacterium]
MRTLFEINHTIPKLLLLALLSSSWVASTASAQWVAYTFSPRAAYLTSYGLSTNTTNNTSTIQTVILSNGWANAQTAAGTIINSNVNSRGVIALYFSTNTNSPNFITATQPLFYTYSTNTNLLSTNNYATNYGFLNLTNTNVISLDATLNTNVWFFNNTRYSSSTRYVAGQFVLSSSNTNAVGTFNSVAIGYTTNQLGTNNWTNAGLTNFLPPNISLKIQALSFAATNTPLNATNQQLILPLTINLTLTKALNNNIATNTNAFATSYTNNLARVISNLPLLIRSNGIVLTNTN